MAKDTTIALKEQKVQEIQTKIQESAATVVVKYEGLTVEEFKELRGQLRAEGVEIEVLKNNISRRAFKACEFEMDEYLVGPTAVAFSKEDVTAAARIIQDYSKKHTAIELKAGTFEGKVADTAMVMELATLPNKDGLLSMLLSVLQAGPRGLAQTLSQVAESKEQ